ncbi:MAG TPA: hypothetical protein DEQ14_10980 [Treponema sp.]|nr:hypothetical protein [Treponema sp.]
MPRFCFVFLSVNIFVVSIISQGRGYPARVFFGNRDLGLGNLPFQSALLLTFPMLWRDSGSSPE